MHVYIFCVMPAESLTGIAHACISSHGQTNAYPFSSFNLYIRVYVLDPSIYISKYIYIYIKISLGL